MKLLLKPIFIIPILIIVSNTANAQETSHPEKVATKLTAGLANVSTSFVELPKTIAISSQVNGIAYGVTAGFMTGILHILGRTLSGAFDLATFIIPTQSMVQPEFIWNDLGKQVTQLTYKCVIDISCFRFTQLHRWLLRFAYCKSILDFECSPSGKF